MSMILFNMILPHLEVLSTMETERYYEIIISAWIACLLFPAMVFANPDEPNRFEIGIEHAELAQNKYRNLGASNYTFFIGKKFDSNSLENWAWRLSFINVELSTEHLRDKDRVCCIKGDRRNLEGELEQHRLYFDYLPYTFGWASVNKKVSAKFSSSLGIGYNRWVTRDVVANEVHDVKAITVGGLFKFKVTFYGRFFIEPALDLGFIVHKNKGVNKTIGSATLDRPENYTFSLLTYIGYIF